MFYVPQESKHGIRIRIVFVEYDISSFWLDFSFQKYIEPIQEQCMYFYSSGFFLLQWNFIFIWIWVYENFQLLYFIIFLTRLHWFTKMLKYSEYFLFSLGCSH